MCFLFSANCLAVKVITSLRAAITSQAVVYGTIINERDALPFFFSKVFILNLQHVLSNKESVSNYRKSCTMYIPIEHPDLTNVSILSYFLQKFVIEIKNKYS